jgi:hypothetical protein
MPREPIDYSKTVIYQIRCLDETLDYIYVGSTTNFRSRKSEHKYSCNNPNNKDHKALVYQKIRENGGWENWKMIPLEEYACNSSTEARIREEEWRVKLRASLNARKAFGAETKQEYFKQYYLENTDKIKERLSKCFVCGCGVKYTLCHKLRHYRSMKHQDWWLMAFS